MSLLERILASKRTEIDAMKSADVEASTVRRGTLPVAKLLRRGLGDPLRVIAEVKMKSPSAGDLSRTLDVAARVEAYARGGATMVSVLVDAPFFGGSWDDLQRARARLDHGSRDVPLLAKEFVLDEVQIDRARALGADAILLIARIVSAERLRELHEAARARDLQPVVEVATETELISALAAGARVIGVNARDLDTLAIDPPRAARILKAIPVDRVAIHLSGLKDDGDVRAVAATRADAVLIGEALMREDDPETKLRALVEAGR